MSLFIFTKYFKNKKIIVYNNGEMYRDFTYIDDVVDAVYKLSLSKKITKITIYLILAVADQLN